MLHLLLYGLLAIIVAVALFLIASRFLPAGEQIAPPLRDEPPWELPAERTLRAEDVDGVRLPVALRGYRFAETDLLLDRLAGELRERDAEIARLRGATDVSEPAPPEAYAPPPVGPDPTVAGEVTDKDVSEAVAEDPALPDPALHDPAPSEPAPSEPAPSEPAPSDPTPSEPAGGDDRA